MPISWDNNYVIIVAGGKGVRMGGEVPKQFLPIGGRPILMRAIERFRQYSPSIDIIVVLPRDQQDYWSRLCEDYAFTVRCRIVDGGATRFHSVKNALDCISCRSPGEGGAIVGVHDGVRPFVPVEVIARCYDEARRSGTAIPVTPVVETLRYVGAATAPGGVTVPRGDYRLVQTPQTFRLELLKEAYNRQYAVSFTDDASVVEAMGCPLTLVDGARENIKITTPFDLTITRALIC